MVKVKLQLPHGFRTKMRRDGKVVVDNPNLDCYTIREKPKFQIVENNLQFGNNSSLLSLKYQALSDSEKKSLIDEMEKEGVYKNLWNYFLKKEFSIIKSTKKKKKEFSHE